MSMAAGNAALDIAQVWQKQYSFQRVAGRCSCRLTDIGEAMAVQVSASFVPPNENQRISLRRRRPSPGWSIPTAPLATRLRRVKNPLDGAKSRPILGAPGRGEMRGTVDATKGNHGPRRMGSHGSVGNSDHRAGAASGETPTAHAYGGSQEAVGRRLPARHPQPAPGASKVQTVSRG